MKAAVVTRVNELARAVRSSQQVHQRRIEIALVVSEGSSFGVGTISPQPHALLGDPSCDDVLDALQHRNLARIAGVGRTETGRNWAQVHSLFGEQPRDRWISAVTESAVLDLDCDEQSRSLEAVFGGGEASFQVVGSLIDGEIEQNPIAARYRIKVSATRRIDFSPLRVLDRPVVLDFNGEVLSLEQAQDLFATASAHARIEALEQAWMVGDFTHPAQLRLAGVRLSHDESIRSVKDLRHAIQYEAIDIAAIKPARCGGFAVAREIARRARQANVQFYIGGFFEGPLGRFRNHALAASLHAGPSDVLHTVTGRPVSAAEANEDRAKWIEQAQREGEWIDIGG